MVFVGYVVFLVLLDDSLALLGSRVRRRDVVDEDYF